MSQTPHGVLAVYSSTPLATGTKLRFPRVMDGPPSAPLDVLAQSYVNLHVEVA
jgi:hypothetical protein